MLSQITYPAPPGASMPAARAPAAGDPTVSGRRVACRPGRVGRGVSLPRGAAAFRLVDAAEEQHAADEEGDEREDAEPAGAGELADEAEDGGPHDPGELLEDAEEAEELGGLGLGDHARVEGSAEALSAALDEADHEGERPEVPGLADEVA